MQSRADHDSSGLRVEVGSIASSVCGLEESKKIAARPKSSRSCPIWPTDGKLGRRQRQQWWADAGLAEQAPVDFLQHRASRPQGASASTMSKTLACKSPKSPKSPRRSSGSSSNLFGGTRVPAARSLSSLNLNLSGKSTPELVAAFQYYQDKTSRMCSKGQAQGSTGSRSGFGRSGGPSVVSRLNTWVSRPSALFQGQRGSDPGSGAGARSRSRIWDLWLAPAEEPLLGLKKRALVRELMKRASQQQGGLVTAPGGPAGTCGSGGPDGTSYAEEAGLHSPAMNLGGDDLEGSAVSRVVPDGAVVWGQPSALPLAHRRDVQGRTWAMMLAAAGMHVPHG